MLDCPRCGRRVPEVHGAPEQECPHCGAFIVVASGARAPKPAPVPVAPTAPVQQAPRVAAPPPRPATERDAAGAVASGVRLWSRRLPTIMRFWAPVFVLDIVLALATVAWQGANGVLGDELYGGGPGSVLSAVRFLGFSVPLYFIMGTTVLAFWGGHTRLVADLKAGRRPDHAAAYRAMGDRLRVVVPTAAALVVLYVAAGMVFVVPFFVVFHWYLFAPAAAASDDVEASVVLALAASRDVAQRERTTGFMLVAAAALFGAMVVAAVGSWGARELVAAFAPDWRFTAEAVVNGLLLWVLGPLAPTIVAVFWLANASPDDAAPVTAPAAAAVAGAPLPTRNTKCPDCLTVFAFEVSPTGGPVSVQCPKCGKTGLVR